MWKYVWFKIRTVPWIIRSYFLCIFGFVNYDLAIGKIKLGNVIFWMFVFIMFILFGVLVKVNIAVASTVLIIYAIGTNLNVRIKR